MAQVHTNGKHGLFLHEQLAHLHTENTDEASKASNIAFDEDIMENNYMFVMLWNLSVISHWIFFISGAKFQNNSRGILTNFLVSWRKMSFLECHQGISFI